MTKANELKPDETKLEDAAVVEDADQSGTLDLDPEKAQMTIADLVILDHKLRDQGSSLSQLLAKVAKSFGGIRV